MPNRRHAAWNGLMMVVLAAAVAVPGVPVAAQDRFNCGDFASQAEAQAELDRTFPDDPNGLDGDADGIACETEFGLTAADEAPVAATREGGRSRARDDNAGGSETAQSTNPPPVAPTAPPATTGSGDVPSDVLARVEGCAVVAISSHSVAAAGCPGGQSIILHTPADAPPMASTVLFNPGAPMASDTEASAASTAATESRTAARETASSAHSRRGKQPDERGKSGAGKTTKDAKNAKAGKKDKKDNKDKKKKGRRKR